MRLCPMQRQGEACSQATHLESAAITEGNGHGRCRAVPYGPAWQLNHVSSGCIKKAWSHLDHV